MAAMNWLATQLAWERRLGELRAGARLVPQPAHDEEHDVEASRRAA
jgi:hypothetical protein